MKFLGQHFQKLEQDRQTHTDATERITQPHSRMIIIIIPFQILLRTTQQLYM